MPKHMNCNICAQIDKIKSTGFSTQAGFEQAKSQLNSLARTNDLKMVESGFVLTYLCAICDSKWELTIPDGSLRGGLEYISFREKRMTDLKKRLNRQRHLTSH